MARPLLFALGLGVVSLCGSWHVEGAHAAARKASLALATQKTSSLDGLSLREVKRLYLGEHLDTPDGKKLVPLNQAARSPERGEFEHLSARSR